MISMIQVAERCHQGPRMSEMDWDMSLYAKMIELAQRYELAMPDSSWETFFNEDHALAERALEAGIAFLAEMGAYCIQTSRAARFSEQEIREAITAAPRQVVVGQGDDARTLGVGPSKAPPGRGTGALHAPFETKIAVDVARSFVESLDIAYIQTHNFRYFEGHEVYGVPLEAADGCHAVAQVREAVRQAGKPDMAVFYYPISTADAVLTAPIALNDGIRPTDGVLFSTLPDIKLDMEMITAAIVYADYGACAMNGGGGAAAGGFCGNVIGGIIESIVKPILGWMAYRSILAGGGVRDVHMSRRKFFRIQPIYSWANSVSAQALALANPLWGGTGLNTSGGVGHCSGPGTRTHLLETAMASIGSGAGGNKGSAADWHVSTMNARRTPYELLFADEVAEATTRASISPTDLPEIMKQISLKLEGLPTEPGMDIRDCWDLEHNKPLSEYRKLGEEIKQELRAEFGLVFESK